MQPFKSAQPQKNENLVQRTKNFYKNNPAVVSFLISKQCRCTQCSLQLR